MKDKKMGYHSFVFNPNDNGGEHLSLVTEIFENNDQPTPGRYVNQSLTLQSYCNSASFCLVGAPLTPNMLRKLADEIVI